MVARKLIEYVLLFIVLTISNTIKGQVYFRHDLLVWGGDSLIVVSESPLKEYFNDINFRNWGQYGNKGIWKIRNDSLFLAETGISPFTRKKLMMLKSMCQLDMQGGTQVK
jgi:hypothetical protein